MEPKEGSCTCKCALCTEGKHCENPDTGCQITTGPDISDLPPNVSEEEAKRLKAELDW